MEYLKQNFKNGEVLMAEQLNHMEEGIAQIAKEVGAGGGGASSADAISYDNTNSGVEFDKVQSVIDYLIANFTGATKNLGDILVAKGINVPDGASLNDLVTMVEPLYKPPTTQSGTFEWKLKGQGTRLSYTLIFPTPFGTVPEVTCTQNNSRIHIVSITPSKTDVVIVAYTDSSAEQTGTFTWTATAD